MLSFFTPAFAQDAAAAAAQPNAFASLAPLVLIMVVFYFLIIKPQNKKIRDHRSMLESISKGDEIVTNGGIFGKVQKVEEEGAILIVEIAENVKIKVRRDLVAEKIVKQAA